MMVDDPAQANGTAPDFPALPLTVQSTYPRLTSAMLSLSMAAIALVARFGPSETWVAFSIGGCDITGTGIGVACLGIAVVCFHLASEYCVLAHASDAFALGETRMKFLGITPNEQTYRLYASAVNPLVRTIGIAYGIGFIALLVGVGFTFFKPFPVLSVILIAYAIASMLISIRRGWIRRRHLAV